MLNVLDVLDGREVGHGDALHQPHELLLDGPLLLALGDAAAVVGVHHQPDGRDELELPAGHLAAVGEQAAPLVLDVLDELR